MNIAVAAFAIRSFRNASSQRFPVYTIIVRLLFVSMAGNAGGFGKTRIVREGLDRSMAIDAREHGAVYGRFKCVSMYRLAINHRRVAVTAQAIVVGEFGGGATACVGKHRAGNNKADYA
jgi:hypothetical protein